MYRTRISNVERMDEHKKTYTDDLAADGTMYVVNHMKLRDHQVSVIHDFFDEYLNLLDHGEEQAEAFYKTIMRI
ncbi:hypothetical protein [Bacillus cereus]|uniref:hypothetical protein n=1 Tax=Bacillus cereus TaxID=1396 RepID=UPI0003A87296|nr:hypothetical protein [Bacillus cereus]